MLNKEEGQETLAHIQTHVHVYMYIAPDSPRKFARNGSR